MTTEMKQLITAMCSYDPCAVVTPACMGSILKALLELADATELSTLTTETSFLPKTAGPFCYNGFPVHQRTIFHSNAYYIVFCTCHGGSSGNSGEQYLVYKKNNDGQYMYSTMYTNTNVLDWVKRSFNECTVTTAYPGLMSSDMLKKLNAVYSYCVSEGMQTI